MRLSRVLCVFQNTRKHVLVKLRMSCSFLACEYNSASLGVLRAMFPEARYWNRDMGELHMYPDCQGLFYRQGRVRSQVFMYAHESRTPLEARGPCCLPGGACVRSGDPSGARTQVVVQVDAFAPIIPGVVFMAPQNPHGNFGDRDMFTAHRDATCPSLRPSEPVSHSGLSWPMESIRAGQPMWHMQAFTTDWVHKRDLSYCSKGCCNVVVIDE